MDTARHADFYQTMLVEDVLPFWLDHSLDREHGGYLTCLDRAGGVYDTDKFLWLQGRQVWTLAKMYRCVRPEPAWLEAARIGAEFVRDHGRDEAGRFYFSLDRAGRPLTRPCIFSDCFCAMGLAEYAAAARRSSPKSADADWARELAMETYRNIQAWMASKPDSQSRYIPDARPMESMVYDMINVNLSLELASTIDDPAFRGRGLASAERILRLFVDRGEGLVFEHVRPDGSHPDTFAGRLITPGHALECLWFLIEAGAAWERPDVIAAAVEAMPDVLQFGWDAEHGGLFYFMDARGKPPERLEWDQKLWWVHGEALVAVLLAYKHTRRAEFARWFERLHDYAWGHFHDGEHGEWFGYLNRAGQVLLDLKGGKWKGCFHVPRSLWLCWKILSEL